MQYHSMPSDYPPPNVRSNHGSHDARLVIWPQADCGRLIATPAGLVQVSRRSFPHPRHLVRYQTERRERARSRGNRADCLLPAVRFGTDCSEVGTAQGGRGGRGFSVVIKRSE